MKHALLTATLTAALMMLSVGTAFGHAGHDHDDDHDYADPVLFAGETRQDCTLVNDTMIMWELTGSDAVTYVELHIDAPEASVTSRNAAPYIFVTPRHDLSTIEADADRILGEIAADAQLIATICDTPQSSDSDTAAPTDTDDTAAAANADDAATPWLAAATGLAGLAIGTVGGRKLGAASSAR